ncbi:MAG: hypothetical protein AABZ12_10660 [Planctomycetota bacterium]
MNDQLPIPDCSRTQPSPRCRAAKPPTRTIAAPTGEGAKISGPANNALPSPAPAATSEPAPPDATSTGNAPDAGKLEAHRERQAMVAKILDATFGQWASIHPDLWERRAYLMLVGMVYERLATSEAELSTSELVALAKALAENRRVEARAEAKTRDDAENETPAEPAELPSGFGQVVRNVYGANWHVE